MEREKEEIIIMMKRGNEIFINNNSVSVEQLFLILTQSAQKNKDALVIIQADQEVSHGSVVKVMDTAKRSGLTRLAIATTMVKQKVTGGKEE